MQNARAMSRKCPGMSALVFEGDPKCSRHVWSQKSLKKRKKSGKYTTFRGLGESRPKLSAFLIALAEVITSARRWISPIFDDFLTKNKQGVCRTHAQCPASTQGCLHRCLGAIRSVPGMSGARNRSKSPHMKFRHICAPHHRT